MMSLPDPQCWIVWSLINSKPEFFILREYDEDDDPYYALSWDELRQMLAHVNVVPASWTPS